MRAQALVKLGRSEEARAEIAKQSLRAARNGEQLFAGYLTTAVVESSRRAAHMSPP
jgi:hypothetical protein